MLAAIVVPFILTTIVGKKKGVDKEAEAAQKAAEEEAAAEIANAEAEKNLVSENEFKAYLDGKVISLQEIGDGLAIIPSNETVCAPVSGKVTVLMQDSKHAVGLTLSNGAEILIHVGIDTVSMAGDGFSYLVKVGDVVKAGQPLLKFSKEKIKAAGHPDTAVLVVTNPNNINFQFKSGMQAKTGETVIATC